MIIIYNKYFPRRPFIATNVLGMVFCRGKKGRLSKVDINHEYIHTLQQREMLYVGFAVWYYLEWLWRWMRCHDRMKAYRQLLFEREAYDMERDLDYRHHRRPYAWARMYSAEGSLLDEVQRFVGDICSFVRDDFRLVKYLFFIATALAIIAGQVCFNVYDIIIAPSYADGTSMLRIPLVYCAAYFFMLIPTLFMHHEQWRLRQWQVWVFPALLVLIDGAGQGFDLYKGWIDQLDIYHKERFYLKLIGAYLFRSVAIIGCLCLFRWFTTGRFGLYGLVRSGKYLRVYMLIFLLLLPMFVIVSFTPQFLDFYPKMDIEFYRGSFGWDDWQVVGLFELFYANDYVAVESMFRGAMVVGLSRWLGPRAVIPMAITYMCIHLGKPDLELCSSVVGGYVLGILAYRTRHLWGGIVVHLGIALLFEALGLMRLLF